MSEGDIRECGGFNEVKEIKKEVRGLGTVSFFTKFPNLPIPIKIYK